MTYEQLSALLPLPTTPAGEAGRAFFSTEVDSADKKKLVAFLLAEKRYTQLCELIYCGHITKQNKHLDYLSIILGASSTLDTRYFGLFLDTMRELGVQESAYMPMLFAAADAPNGTSLRAWSSAIEMFLTRRAYEDYNGTAELLFRYDVKFRFMQVLIRVDRAKTVAALVERALYGKHIQKTHLRRFLRNYKTEVVAAAKAAFTDGKVREREAAVRLLLLYKNDADASRFLREVASADTSVAIRRLLHNDAEGKQAKKKEPDAESAITGKSSTERFYDEMISGKTRTPAEFAALLNEPDNEAIASNLFFSVYKNGRLHDIVIVDKGAILNLQNEPTSVPDDCAIGVLHPIELGSKYEYLQRLQLYQPFKQVRRNVYVPDESDKAGNSCERIRGTVVSAGDLKSNMRLHGFKALNRDRDGIVTQIGLRRGDMLCVLDISPTDFRTTEQRLVTAGSVRFYAYADIIKLNGGLYVEGVPVLPIARMDGRTFSEFVYAVYEVLGCL